MKCRVMLLLCVLAAGSAQAGGITSFEPDTLPRVRAERARPAMVSTPVWYGTTWAAGSSDREHASPRFPGSAGFGLTASWPWKSIRQGWFEGLFLRRVVRYTVSDPYLANDSLRLLYSYESSREHDTFVFRSGVEHRFGSRPRPLATLGAGMGAGFGADAGVLELLARASVFVYPTHTMRIGITTTGGPFWFVTMGTQSLNSDHTIQTPSNTLAHLEVALRIERKLRFPQAVAEPAD